MNKELIKDLEELLKAMETYNALEIRVFEGGVKSTIALYRHEAGLVELALEKMLEDLMSELEDEDE